jgi:single-strand DNA-binding protein
MFKNIQIIGNLGKDPEIRNLQSGGLAANMSVAVNEQWTTSEGLKESRVTWFPLVVYQTGEKGLITSLVKPHLRKGQLVFVSGDPTIRRWTHSDGSDRFTFEIKLGPQSTIRMLGGRPGGEKPAANGHDAPQEGGEGAQAPADKTPARMSDDDLPPF